MHSPVAKETNDFQMLSMSRSERFGLTAFAVVLALLALALLWGGTDAIVQQRTTYQWRARGTVGPAVHGATTLTGADAIRFGVAMCFFGSLLALWAGGVLVHVYVPRAISRPAWLLRTYMACALALLFITCILLARPWTLTGVVFWTVAVIFSTTMSSREAHRVIGIVFTFLVVISLIVAAFAVWVAAAIPLGIFAAIAGYSHGWILFHGASPPTTEIEQLRDE